MARIKNLLNAETLVWISRLGTFRAAAEKLYTTQPTISARMKELEQTLGVPLFERRGRHLELTLAARRFVERVEPLLHSVEDAFIVPDDDSLSNTVGRVRIGLGEITMSWFSGLVPELRRALPRISYELRMDLAYRLKKDLQMGELDMAIVAGPVEKQRFISHPLGSARMVWMVSSGLLHDEKGRRKSLQELLKTVPLWCIAQPSEYSVAALRTLRKQGANLDNVCTCNHIMALIDLVERGAGMGQLPEILVADRVFSGKLVPLYPELDSTTLDFSVVCHRDNPQPVVDHIMKTVVRLGHYAPVASTPAD